MAQSVEVAALPTEERSARVTSRARVRRIYAAYERTLLSLLSLAVFFALWEWLGSSGAIIPSYNPAGERHFGSADWRRIVESGGEFSAIGYTMITNKPVAGFKDRKKTEE